MRHWSASNLNNLAVFLIVAGSMPLTGDHAGAADMSAEIGSRFESNASNSDQPGDRLADGFLTVRVDAGTKGVFGRDWRWQARLSGTGEEAFRYQELSQIEGGVRLGMERKFGLGWNAPRLQFDVYSAFRGAGQVGASGLALVPSLALVWQIAERAGAGVRYVPQWFFAQGTLFDSAAQEVRLSGWFDLFPGTRLLADFSFRHGDVVSYATPPRPDLAAIAQVKETTDVFGAERIAYRFDADTYGIQFGIDQSLASHVRLRAVYRLEITDRGNLQYTNNIAEIGLRVRF
jgi:hypothetical protein